MYVLSSKQEMQIHNTKHYKETHNVKILMHLHSPHPNVSGESAASVILLG